MKIYSIIIQFVLIQQFFFAATAGTYNNPAAAQSVIKSVTPAVNDSSQKAIDANHLQTTGAFPNIYPRYKT